MQRLMYSMWQRKLAGASARGASTCHESEEETLSQLWLPALRVVQIILSVAVIIFILLQARGAGLGSAFGGSSAGSVFKTRRGVERLIFNLTIVFVVLFAVVSIITLVLPAK
jgi:preprotein translocase subunit SecG